MKTAISVPNPVFQAAEKLAAARGWTRSRLYTEALSEFIATHHTEDTTARLDALYAHEGADLDAAVMAIQDASVAAEDW